MCKMSIVSSLYSASVTGGVFANNSVYYEGFTIIYKLHPKGNCFSVPWLVPQKQPRCPKRKQGCKQS